jgi:Ser/Thr protein kinase RdoA (MazF antagonist)
MTFDAFRCDEWGGLAYQEDEHPLLSTEQKSIFRQAIDKAESALVAWRKQDGLSLIHADLHLKNTNWYRGQIGVFDFDDCRWGHFLQDWGVILSWFQDDSDENKLLRNALIRGYESQRVLSYSEYDLKLAVLHRSMAGLTFMINFRPQSRQAAIYSTYQWLETHLEG